jgi:3-dehydroquinate synthase
MQESFDVLASSGSYQVLIGEGLLEKVFSEYPDAFYIVDAKLKNILPENFKSCLFIEASEDNKTLEKMPNVILKMREAHLNRTSHLVAIGGGIIQDIATFVTSIYMRGIEWTYMPTTLLGMADSCIGGKSSINTLGYKNLIGNFYPPKSVSIDMRFIKTLDADQVIGGLFEAVKICYAKDNATFLAYLQDEPKFPLNASLAQRLLSRALKTKKWFIEIDEFDQNERLLLNFGHTFGHALEAGTDFAIAHGIAVGIGMVIAIEYAKQNNHLNQEGLGRAQMLSNHVRSMIAESLSELVANFPKLDLVQIVEKFDHDKKHQTNSYRMIIPKEGGALTIINQDKTEEVRQKITKAYQSGLNLVAYPHF